MATAEEVKALYRTRFASFVRFAYRELHPGQPLVDAWHIDVLAEHLERIARGEITRLIIDLPPRSLKSLSASIALPVWMLGAIRPSRSFRSPALASSRATSRRPRAS